MTCGRAHIEPISCTAVTVIRTVRSPNAHAHACPLSPGAIPGNAVGDRNAVGDKNAVGDENAVGDKNAVRDRNAVGIEMPG
jgi:hypothetical protein